MLSLYSRFSELETIYVGKRRICGPPLDPRRRVLSWCVFKKFQRDRTTVARMNFILHVIYAI